MYLTKAFNSDSISKQTKGLVSGIWTVGGWLGEFNDCFTLVRQATSLGKAPDKTNTDASAPQKKKKKTFTPQIEHICNWHFKPAMGFPSTKSLGNQFSAAPNLITILP